MTIPLDDAYRIAHAAIQNNWQVMTAESCTGGLAAVTLTSLQGASQWFNGGVVAYSNALKQQLLKVPEKILAKYGAVSEQTAHAMCTGLLPWGAQAALATTGIAGPEGGSRQKPVGTVCFGFYTPDTCYTLTRHFDGDRTAVCTAATLYALAHLAKAMASSSRTPQP